MANPKKLTCPADAAVYVTELQKEHLASASLLSRTARVWVDEQCVVYIENGKNAPMVLKDEWCEIPKNLVGKSCRIISTRKHTIPMTFDIRIKQGAFGAEKRFTFDMELQASIMNHERFVAHYPAVRSVQGGMNSLTSVLHSRLHPAYAVIIEGLLTQHPISMIEDAFKREVFAATRMINEQGMYVCSARVQRFRINGVSRVPSSANPTPTRPTAAPTRPTVVPTRPTTTPTRKTAIPPRPAASPARPTATPTRLSTAQVRPMIAQQRPTTVQSACAGAEPKKFSFYK